jgi:glyoxylate/hydroxypyruvate reductase A
MRIVFCCPHTPSAPWLQGLRAALPQAQVDLWTPAAPLADYALVWQPPQRFFDEQTQLRAVFNIGAGVDALLGLRLPHQAQVVRLDDAGMAVQMAEYVCHAVIGHFRDFENSQTSMRSGNWSFHEPAERADFSVGVMGLGVLGARVARALQVFEFPVNGWSRQPKAISGVRCFAGAAELDAFLAASRVLVCLLPLNPHTENILNRQTLSRLQPKGYLVNVARGKHLVEEDLLALLQSGHLAGATLDVFRTEPLALTHPFWQQPGMTLTPHMAARTSCRQSVAQIVRKIHALEQGLAISGVVDMQRGY